MRLPTASARVGGAAQRLLAPPTASHPGWLRVQDVLWRLKAWGPRSGNLVLDPKP